jgi:hypothetical protein
MRFESPISPARHRRNTDSVDNPTSSPTSRAVGSGSVTPDRPRYAPPVSAPPFWGEGTPTAGRALSIPRADTFQT